MTVLAIVNLFPGAYLSVKKSETSLQCDFIANSVLEELRMTPFSQLPAGDYTQTGEPFDIHTVDNVAYSPKVTIYDVPGTDPTIVRGVRVEITYKVRSRSTTVTHETYLHSLVR